MAKLLREQLPVDALRGKRPDPAHLETVLEDGDRVYKPDGSPLAILRRRTVSVTAAEQGYAFLHSLRSHRSMNRGDYTGMPREKVRRTDGKHTNSPRLPYDQAPASVIVGYFDRNPRHPFCRQTQLTSADPDGWGTLQPLIREVSDAFREALPGRYAAQEEAARATHPAYVIPGTPFTTLTVNNTVAAAYHYDKGDYKAGFGVIVVLRRGQYTGGELVVPAFRVGADLHDRDMLLFDVHELHGNLPIVGEGPKMLPEKGGHERISIVFYFRNRMVDCLAPGEEILRAKLVTGDVHKPKGEVRGVRWKPGDE